MIKKILIANRGEIAIRVMKTCKKLGISSIGVFAENDTFLPHASFGDENYCLGSGSLQETYLNIDKIINIAKFTGADAIHPGYGFLSENTEFCKQVKKAGLIFIGPSVEAIELMGDKKESKVAMEKLGVPLIPGYHGEDQNKDFLFEEAKKIGFPVLIKATAGGGGKGMRIVRAEAEFMSALESSKREALNAFSNDKVLLEKYIENPRHIEVQIVSDGGGNHFHFFERECSIQRRYQKVIEETPSAALSDELRGKICQTAVEIAKGINYLGAGTIEYILAPDQNYYFLEMNTRLQVEHPITELVTNRDLVELQIQAANGESFNFKQTDIKQNGHAIECRLYAEDPDNEFLPTVGRIQKVHLLPRLDFRLDSGYKDGNNISTSYDPMLAKLIVHESDRFGAISKMQEALNDVVFAGTKTNRDFLKRVLGHKDFVNGDYHTHFLEQNIKSLEKENPGRLTTLATAAALIFKDQKYYKGAWANISGEFQKSFSIQNIKMIVSSEFISPNTLRIEFEGEKNTFRFHGIEDKEFLIEIEGEIKSIFIFPLGEDEFHEFHVFCDDDEFQLKMNPKVKRAGSSKELSEGSLLSPMPGKIFKVMGKTGQKVDKGDPILIVEAMKMEHMIKSPKAGIIKEIFFKEGEQVKGGVSLCEIE